EDRRAHFHRQIHDLDDFCRVGLAKASAKYCKVLRKKEDEAAVDSAVPRDKTVAGNLLLGHSEIQATMCYKTVHFNKRTFIEQQRDALTRRQLSFFVLLLVTFFAAALFGQLIPPAQIGKFIAHDFAPIIPFHPAKTRGAATNPTSFWLRSNKRSLTERR